MADAVARAPPKKRRRKTFTGCWTCRRRRVKCDEQRPHCKRCQNGGFECHGYGVRLTWVSQEKGVKSFARLEEHLSADTAVPPAIESVATEPPQIIQAADDGQTAGNFTTFRAKAPNIDQSQSPDDNRRSASTGVGGESTPLSNHSDNASLDSGIDISLNDVSYINPSNATWDFPQQNFDQLMPPFADMAAETWLIPNGDALTTMEPLNTWPTEEALEVQATDECSALSILPKSPSAAIACRTSSRKHDLLVNDPQTFANLLIGSIGMPLDDISTPAIQRGLISHWITQLSDKLIPFRSSVNPFRTVASPMALEGSRLAKDKSKSTGSIALFHAVCAASAAHQDNLRGASPECSILTVHHTQLALDHLVRNMNSADVNERLAVLGALCLSLLTHFIRGTPGVWRELVKITRDLLESVGRDTWTQSTSTSLTYQCYALSFAFIQSQYSGHHEPLLPLKIDLAGLDLYKSQAIPAKTLELVSTFNTKILQERNISEEELDELEMEFALTTPPPSPDVDLSKQDSAAMYHHHSSLFYYASLLYFKSTSGRRGSEDEVQDLVARCLEHLEHLDAMPMGGGPRSWIYATIAFEAHTPALRDRVRASFGQRRSLAFATFDTILLAAEEAWKRRDANPGLIPKPWPRTLSEMPQFDIILY